MKFGKQLLHKDITSVFLGGVIKLPFLLEEVTREKMETMQG